MRMKVALDIDGTISEHPEFFTVLGLRRRQPALDLVRVQDGRPAPHAGPYHPRMGGPARARGRFGREKDARCRCLDRVARSLPMPGIVILRILLTIGQAIAELELIALAGKPDDLGDQVIYLPL